MKDKCIETKLVELGLNPGLKGFSLLKDLIILISTQIEMGNRQNIVLQNLYNTIATKYNIATSAVDRNIRTLIQKSKSYRGMNLTDAVFLIELQIRGIK